MIRILFFLLIVIFVASCKKQTAEGGADFSKPNCFDGIKNQDEIGIDCGGICGVPCNGIVTASINGSSFTSSNAYGVANNSTSSFQFICNDSISPYRNIQVGYTGTFAPGTKTAQGTYFVINGITYKYYNINTTTTLNVTSFDTQNKLVSGNFSFKGFASATDSVIISNGEFNNVRYQ
ncbi:MAG: hypothetical protein IPJ79_09995 [Bacteroidetes bacterium]|nr:hypothetical protein [Bacteroidota bacterium]